VKSGAIETSKEVLIKNSLGLHARAAAQLVKTAELFNSDVWLEKNGKSVDAKSVISLLTLECPPGSKVIIKARGQDSQIAIEAISKLIEDDFGE